MPFQAVLHRGFPGFRHPRRNRRSSFPHGLAAWRDQRGSMAVEFAIIGPLLVLLLLGIVVYGGYFMLSHSVQQMADDSARAAVAGLTDTERQQLASTAMANDAKAYNYLVTNNLKLSYADQNSTLTVQIAYDASTSPFWALNGIVPMPPSNIVRSASVQLGGF